MTLPISPVTLPRTLVGMENGSLPSSVLVTITLDDADDVVVEKTAARAFKAMFAAARAALGGLRVREVGGYRDFKGQKDMFEDRMESVPYEVYLTTPSTHRRRWPEALQYGHKYVYFRRVRGAACAVPRRSNHGWALAIDIAENLDADYTAEGISARFVNWLIANAHRFGISAELQDEPWHWRYVAGDNIPQAVLTYEGGATPTTGEDDMIDLDEPQRIYDSREVGDSVLDPNQSRAISIPFSTQKPDGTGGMKAVEVNVTVITDGRGGFVTVTAGDLGPGKTSDLNWNSGEGTRNMQMRVKVDSKTGTIRVHNGPTRVLSLIVDWKAYAPR